MWIIIFSSMKEKVRFLIESEDGEAASSRRMEDEGAGPPQRRRSISEDRRGTAYVELTKREGSGLGLVISGGLDKEKKPRISFLRPGGIAHRSDALEVGDYLIAVNGIRTAMLSHDEIINVLKNAKESILLEVEYELPDPPQNSFSVICKRIEVRLKRSGPTFGFTLRGGIQKDPKRTRPLTVTQIRPGGAADRDGTLKVGDRLLAINGVNVTQLTLTEAMVILHQSQDESLLFLVEYDVSVIEAVQNATGPLLVEIDKNPGSNLGITLATAPFKGKTVICIENIKPASIADRCGALHFGDHVLSIDDTGLEHMSVMEASQLLRCSAGEQTRLEILPMHQTKGKTLDHTRAQLVAPKNLSSAASSINSFSSLQSFGTYNSLTTQVGSACGGYAPTPGTRSLGSGGTLRSTGWGSSRSHQHSTSIPPVEIFGEPYFTLAEPHSHLEPLSPECVSGTISSATFPLPPILPASQVCHTETTEVVLVSDHRGFGFSLQGGVFATEILMEPPIISHIEPQCPAERSAVLQEGDRILAINGEFLENRTLEEANQMIRESGLKVTLLVEFDVAESVVPSSGVFTVKLAKRGPGLGITLTSSSNRKQGEPLIISDVKKGSIAHRTGTIQPGDKLIAIDQTRLENCSMEDAAEILQNTEEIVRLKIQKDEAFSEDIDTSNTVTYTVELQKYGGPLGITISGTEEPFDPILISGLTEGGLAERTGALHIGDRILAINGSSLRGRPLSDAISMLQNAGETVTLRITRNTNPKNRNGVAGKSHDSVDSALESWDSSGLDGNNVQSKPCMRRQTRDSNGSSSTGEGSGAGSTSSQGSQSTKDDINSRPVNSRAAAYCDIENELRIDEGEWENRSAHSPSAPSCASTNEDEWSKRLDELDMLSQSDAASNMLSQSDINSQIDATQPSNQNCDDIEETPPPPAEFEDDDNEERVATAEMHLKEVEEQLQNIFTPTPVELFRVTLYKFHEQEDFGFSLSDGVYEKGVYISAVRPNGPAERSGGLKPFDRLLEINGVKTKDLDCCQVVPLITTSGLSMDLVISRNPLAGDEADRLERDIWEMQEAMGDLSVMTV